MEAKLRIAAVALAGAALAACGGEAGSTADAAQRSGTTSVVSFQALNESGMMGSLMLAPGDRNVTVKVEVLGLKEGESYPAHLHEGRCEAGGEAVVELEGLTVNSLGIGSSSTQVARSTLSAGAHFVQVHLPDGTPAACADLP